MSVKSLSKYTRQNFSGTAFAMSTILQTKSFKLSEKPEEKEFWGRCWAKIRFRKTLADV